MSILRALQSFIAAMRASAAFGRAQRLERDGQQEGALEVSRGGLRYLHEPYVNRRGAPEASAMVSLTVFVEQAAQRLGTDGPSLEGLENAAKVLEPIANLPGIETSGARAQFLYINSRIAAKAHGAA